MSIQLRNLAKHYYSGSDRKRVLADVTLDIGTGDTYALTGPNGAGKTTLLKIIATLVLPSSGGFFVCGVDAVRFPARARRLIGIVCDTERSFYQFLSVRENLQFYARLFGVPEKYYRKRLEELLEPLGLEASLLDVKMGHCSSGARQKLALLRALLPDPPVLLVDELSRSLDAEAREKITRYVKHILAPGGKTILIVTHDLPWSQEFATATGTLRDGRIGDGTPGNPA